MARPCVVWLLDFFTCWNPGFSPRRDYRGFMADMVALVWNIV